MKKLILLLMIPIMIGCTKEPYPIQLSAEYIVPLDTITAPDGDQIIFEKRMTATEKIKKRFKEIHDAKIERLKECEDNKLITAKLPEENPTQKELQRREYFDKYDLAGTSIIKNATGETKDVYLLTLSSIVKLWDEYAKECGNDTLIIPTRDLMWTKPSGYKAVGLRFIGDDANYIYVRQPDPIEFITVFLRNKSKGN